MVKMSELTKITSVVMIQFDKSSVCDQIRIDRCLKVKSMQKSGTEAIRTQIQPSKPKREIPNTVKWKNFALSNFRGISL